MGILRQHLVEQEPGAALAAQLPFVDRHRQGDGATAERNHAGVAAGKEMNLDLAAGRARAAQTALKTDGTSLHGGAAIEAELLRHP